MSVCVDQPRHHELAFQIDYFGFVSNHGFYIRVRAYDKELAILDRDGFGPRLSFINCVDFSVCVDGVRNLSLCDRSKQNHGDCNKTTSHGLFL